MVGIDYYFFGYRELNILAEKLSLVSSIFLRNGIQSKITFDGIIIVRERDVEKIRHLLTGRSEYSLSKPLGVLGSWRRFDHKLALLFSIVVSVVFGMFLSSLVWDVRIEGNENISNSEYIYRLSECDFAVGDFWNKKDLSEIETLFLSRYNDTAWININRRGTVAYISVMEKENNSENINDRICFSNIVATTDCIIEEITVKSGIAVVKPGDAVKKGDPLILGTLPDEAGGGFCRAEGSVIGRVNDSVSVEVDEKYEIKRLLRQNIISINVKFFKKSLNIFKLYRNLTSKCAIIENEKEYSLLCGQRLPFSLTVQYEPIYESVDCTYDDEELVSIARDRLTLATALHLRGSDLISIRTHGEFTDRGYSMTSDVVFACEVGVEKSFDIE